MAKKYKISPTYKGGTLISTSKPEGRKSGLFDLSKCTQAELKYLHDVVGHKAVIIEDAKDEKEASKEE